jgi:hypothetical protein
MSDYALRITYPTRAVDPDSPFVEPRERRIGPFGATAPAEMFARKLTEMPGRARPVGYTLEVVPFDGEAEHESPFLPRDAESIAAMVDAEPDLWGPYSWPDVHDLLLASHGYLANTLYRDALAILDTRTAMEEYEAQGEAERAAAAEAAEARLAPARALIAEAAAERPGVDYPDHVRDQAAAFLADMLDLGEVHSVPRDEWGYLAKVPGVCLEAIATVRNAAA